MQKGPGGFRLSPQQKRLWLIQQGSPAFTSQCAMRLAGELRPELLRAALTAIVNRHEALRTGFHLEPGINIPFQVVSEDGTIHWREVDLSDKDAPGQQCEIESLSRQEARLSTGLQHGSRLRAVLVKLTGNQYALLLTVPPLCADDWTLASLFKELGDAYAATLRDESLPEAALQYAGFSEWQNELQEEDEAEAGREFWRKQSLDEIPALSLPFESSDCAGAAFEPESFALSIDRDRAAKIKSVARERQVSAEVVLLACWQALLWRLTGESDIIVGLLCSCREYEVLQGLMGPVARWLPAHSRFSRDSSFSEALSQTAQYIQAGAEWRDYFALEHGPWTGGDKDGVAYFPLGFEYQAYPEEYTAGGVRFSSYERRGYAERFDLSLRCVDMGDGLAAEFHYDLNRFRPEDIRSLASRYELLLSSALENTQAPIARLEIMREAERRRLLLLLNDTATEYPRDKSIHRLFEEQVARTPDRVAVESGDERLTYQELNAFANQIARRLRKLGVGPDAPVGLCIDRSAEMMAGLLGILKAGGGYVPLNPEQPRERLAFMLNDAHLRVVVTKEGLSSRLHDSGVRFVCVDSDYGLIAQEGAEDLDCVATAENLSHIIYTSGSTGRPKGVAVNNGSVLNFWLGFHDAVYPPFAGQRLRVGLNAPLSFDGSIKQYLLLLHGHTAVILPQEIRADGRGMVSFLKQNALNVLDCTPTQLGLMISAGILDGTVSKLKLVLVSGEQIKEPMWQRLKRARGVTFYNVYGPTECTVDTTVFRIAGDAARPTIGRPLANTRVYILDHELNLVPEGLIGELHIGGEGLARGYINRPDMTAEKFIPDPFSMRPGKRIYKTGDLVRYGEGGNIEFLDRIDQQVKIRGFRVELAEVEEVLKEHPAVKQSVAVAREDSPGDERLVAYVVARDRHSVRAGELRSFLVDRLPEYMVPSSFVFLDQLPLTLSGKVNRRALPAPIGARLESDHTYQTPDNPVEGIVSAIWAKLLGLERVRREDNFFQLGGHSILVTQLMSRLHEAIQVDLPVRALFEAPTVAELVLRIEEARHARKGFTARPILPVARDEDLPLSFAQQRLWFLHQMEPDSPAFNIRMAFRLKGDLKAPALEECINEIIRRHEALRTTFKASRGQPSQVIAQSLRLPLPVVDLTDLDEPGIEIEVAKLAAEQARSPFDLGAGPLLRATLLTLGDMEHVVLFTMHHIISDGWSAGVLLREVVELYSAFLEARPSRLPELTIQYADFAHWQRGLLRGEVLESHLAYWKRQLHGAEPLALKTDHARPAVSTYRGDRIFFKLPQPLTFSLREMAHQDGVTAYIVLLAAFQTLLYRYSGQREIVIGSDVANRTRVETERLIGFFVNQLVIRTDFSGRPTFRELLRRVRDVTLDGYDHQDLPFDTLVQALNPERRANAHPLFQVKIVFQNFQASQLSLPGLSLSPVQMPSGATQLDLILFVWDMEHTVLGRMEYSKELFEADTITRMLGHFETLLQSIVDSPDACIDDLAIFTEAELEQQMIERSAREEVNRKKLIGARRKAVTRGGESQVRIDFLRPDQPLPLVIQPASGALDPAEWACANRQFIEARLLEHGALLLRGFGIRNVSGFERFAQAICSDLFTDNGELPREKISGRIYTPVKYPSDKPILWHNENTFAPRWPMKIFFFCVTPARAGGETPIVDSRKVFQRMDPEIREEFMRKGIRYSRSYGEGLGLDWQTVFQTSDRAQVEDFCRNNSISVEWKDGGRLRTGSDRPAVAKHPKTGEMVWINQATHWHVHCLDPEVRASLYKLFREEDFPRHCSFGDGSPIADSVMESICQVYRDSEVCFPWQRGDMLVLDNMLTAHARNPYIGPRELYVAMGEMIGDQEI